MTLITTSEQLQSFRNNQLNADAFHKTIMGQPGALFCPLPVGVGKSTLIDNVLEDFQANQTKWQNDLAIVSAPTHRILEERKIISHPEASSFLVQLKGRPYQRCGNSRNDDWRTYEGSACIALGKKEICMQCSDRKGCFWPDQFQQITPDIRIVLLPQKYLDIFPGVINQIISKKKAKAPLILLDETNFSQDIFRRQIKRGAIENFLTVMDMYLASRGEDHKSLKEYRKKLFLLLQASSRDIGESGWFFPPIDGDIAADLQEIGINHYGENFYYPGFDLTTFSQQFPGNRILLDGRHIEFVSIPHLEKPPAKLVVFSGTASQPVLEHRLNFNLVNLYPEHRFLHQHTSFYNINTGSSMRMYHSTHLAQMLFFTLGYIKKNMKQNRTVALITKKLFVEETILRLNRLLDESFLPNVRIVEADKWSGAETDDTYQIPLLHYGGAIGVNKFADVDCIVCLCGYYMRQDELNRMLNEVLNAKHRTKFRIATHTKPLRRVPVPEEGACQHIAYAMQLAEEILQQEEMGVVIQAIGRVRPFTKKREVITCQCGESPLMPYDREFATLKETLSYFNLPSRRSYEANKMEIRVNFGKMKGYTQREIADITGISLRTVTRRWNKCPQFF